MKKIYLAFCKFETILASGLLLFIMTLVFISALARYFGTPINWAQDICLVAFAWMIFLGSDIAVRGPGLIGINLLVKHFPNAIQKALDIVFKITIIIFLSILVVNGMIMVVDGWAREITTLGISYSWVTLSVPVGSFFMIISTVIRLVESIKIKTSEWSKVNQKVVEESLIEDGGV